MKAADSVETIERYIDCCLIKGSCFDCPFYLERREDYLNSRCMGSKQYGGLMKIMIEDIKKELGHGQNEKGRPGKNAPGKSGGE